MKDTHGGNIWQAARQAGVDPAAIIDFSANINPFGPPSGVIEAIKNSINVIPPYPDPDCVEIKAALAAHHGVDPDEVLAGNGSTQFIYLIPQVFNPPVSKTALIIEPAFSEYKTSLKLYGCGVESLVLREGEGFELDVTRLERELRKGHRLLYIANPANPTGALIKKSRMFEVAGLCEKLGVTLALDEAFMDFCEEESFKGSVKIFRNMLIVRSMTKFFAMAGLRLGYVIANRDVIKRLSGHLPPWSVNSLAAVAGCHALKDRAFMEDTRKRIREERAAFGAMLDSTGAVKTYPSAANFLMARVTAQGFTGPLIKAELLKKGILVRDLSAAAGLGPQYLRFAVRNKEENSVLVDALALTASNGSRSRFTASNLA
ncbi:MAG: threonine-phosphate decarboxylase [Deltaproteobacteria bacterium]|nr:threonine-phosphate decarboxylase [Deltaproteobacteria bacterium]